MYIKFTFSQPCQLNSFINIFVSSFQLVNPSSFFFVNVQLASKRESSLGLDLHHVVLFDESSDQHESFGVVPPMPFPTRAVSFHQEQEMHLCKA